MKKLLFATIISMATLSVAANNFSDTDTTITKTGGALNVTPKAPKITGPLMVTKLDAFVDSVYNTIPDSMPFFDWITDDIHQKKFNFGKEVCLKM